MRTFIAVGLPPDVLRDVGARVDRLRAQLPRAAWVRTDSLHLTLAFLGEQDETLVPTICSALERRIAPLPAFSAAVHGAGFFPSPRNARAAWLGIEPEAPLHALAGAARDAASDAGITIDGARFKPHLTLCRLRDRWPPASVELLLSTFGAFESAAFTIDTVTLFSSRLDPKGAVHTPMCRLTLTRP